MTVIIIDINIQIQSFLNLKYNIDVFNDEQMKLYTFIITKVGYLIPHMNLDALTIQMVASDEYQRSCVPGIYMYIVFIY